MKSLRHALVFISALLGTSLLHATPGDLDLSFGGGTGKVTTTIGASDDYGQSVIQQTDGKLAAAGTSWNGSNYDFALVRYNADGSLDTDFDGNGKVTTAIGTGDDFGWSVIQQADGKLVVVGRSSNGSNADVALVRYNADGSLDTGFDGDGKVTTAIGGGSDYGWSIIQQADGKLVVTGRSFNGSNNDVALVRYNADGSLDTGFDGDGKVTTAIGGSDDIGYSVIQQSDGKLVVAGTSHNGSNADVALVRYNADGSLDSSFGGGTGKVTTAIGWEDVGQSVIQQADGKLVVAGRSSIGSNYDFALVRYNADGSLDTSFDGDGKVTTAIGGSDNYGYSVIQQSDGKLVVAGRSYLYFALVRYNADGSLDTGFGWTGKITTDISGSGDDEGYSVIQQSDGRLVVAGFSKNGSNSDFALVRYESGQLDTDNDGIVDWLDSDNDGDGVDNLADNCPNIANADQKDLDGDGMGDVCDDDIDDDGVLNDQDAFPYDPNESVDTDGDGVGDNSDLTPNGDTDGDGVDNLADNCPTVFNPNQLDWDDNGIGDACDDPVPMPDDVKGASKVDKTGSSVAFAGDFNGDGYGDYVVGMPGYDLPADKMLKIKAKKDIGRAAVISGKDGEELASIEGVAAKDTMGFAVAGGADIDGDDLDDVVASAPNAGATHTGTVTVLYGRADNTSRNPVAINGTAPKSLFGAAVALGDVDGNGYPDVIVGAPKATSEIGIKQAGSVTVYSGDGLEPIGTPFYGATAKAYAGTAVAAGDVDGDGNADIVIGAPNDDENSANKDTGSVKVYNIARAPLLEKYGTKKSQFGKAVAVGFVNTDTNADVLVGAPLDDDLRGIKPKKDTGSVTVFSGSNGVELIKKYGANTKAQLGYSVAASDVNGDNKADIIAGAWKDNKPTTNPKKPIKMAGSVSVWSGSNYEQIGGTIYGDVAKDYFGAAVGAGDINSDGKADIIIGMPGFDLPVTVNGKTKLLKDVGKATVVSGAGF